MNTAISFEGFEELNNPYGGQVSVLELTGLIPSFYYRALADGARNLDEIASSMLAYYQFGGRWYGNENGEQVDADGTYRYPEDPDLEPLARIYDGLGETSVECFIYLYGIVVLRDTQTGEFAHTRMD